MRKKIVHRQAFALPIVLMVILVLMIFFASLMFFTQSNTKQVTLQEDNLRAYYLARSGIDIAYNALMENNEEKFNKLFTEKATIEHKDLVLPNTGNPIGYVDIEASYNNDGGTEGVRIHAIARTKNGKGTSRLSLYIDKDNTSRITWVKE